MLDRRRRIHTDRDHRTIWRNGRVVRNRTVVLRYLPSTSQDSRYGFVVSSAVAKRATIRNLIKRRLRAVAKQADTKRSIDAIIYATKAAAKATYAELQNDLLSAIQLTAHAQTPHRRH